MNHPLLLPQYDYYRFSPSPRRKLAFLILKPFAAIFRLGCISVLLVAMAVYALVADAFSNRNFELPAKKRRALTWVTRRGAFAILKMLNFDLQVVGQRNSQLLLSTHSSYLDFAALMAEGVNCMALCNEKYLRLLKPLLRMGRCIDCESGFRTGEELRRRAIEGGWPATALFPMGTTVRQGISIRLRNCFFSSRQRAYLVKIEYFSADDVQTLVEGRLQGLWRLLFNYGGKVRLTYMGCVEPSPMKLPSQLAQTTHDAFVLETGFESVDCSYRDLLWFRGSSGINALTREYSDRFGWLGKYRDYYELCKKHKLDSRYYWQQVLPV